jgi:4-amino-4-deoxy-L-arabinose transferase-like glycosyltransferase
VGYLTFPLISAAAVAFAVLILRRFGFSGSQSVAGGIAVFFCTSLFPYTQIHQENSCLLLLTLISFYGVLSWRKMGSGPYLMLTGAALGLSILIRLTAVFDLAAVRAFAVLISRDAKHTDRNVIAAFGKYVIPFVIIALAVDRIYQFERFGTWTDTYLDRYARQVLVVYPQPPGIGQL